MLPTFTAESLQEGDKILLLLLGQLEWFNPPVEILVLDTAAVVMFDHLFQRFEPTIVHVGAGPAISRNVGVLKRDFLYKPARDRRRLLPIESTPCFRESQQRFCQTETGNRQGLRIKLKRRRDHPRSRPYGNETQAAQPQVQCDSHRHTLPAT